MLLTTRKKVVKKLYEIVEIILVYEKILSQAETKTPIY